MVIHNRQTPKGDWLMWLVVAAFLLTFAGGWATLSYFEARAFNKQTGASVTTWDAMFIELRVESTPTE